MSPGQMGDITGQMGRVPGTDGTHTRGCPAKILYVYWFFSFPSEDCWSLGKLPGETQRTRSAGCCRDCPCLEDQRSSTPPNAPTVFPAVLGNSGSGALQMVRGMAKLGVVPRVLI